MEELLTSPSNVSLDVFLTKMIDLGISVGSKILLAIVVFLVGRWIVRRLNKLLAKILEKRHVEASLSTFVKSLVNITLTLLLIIVVIGVLGIETSSFIALFASAGVAIGMALSGTLQNFAGGVMILLFKPFKVGDTIEAQGQSGTVREIQIFHTILLTADNKNIFIPNGSLSSGVVTNIGNEPTRRVEWTFGVEYGSDYEHVKRVIESVLAQDARVLNEPAPFIALSALADSSVNVVVRVWVKSSDYWGVYFDTNKAIYATFNAEGIGFPFPQLTVHQAKD